MNDFQKYLAEEFAEEYQEGRITRREALRLIVSVTGSVLAANAILAACTPVTETPGEAQPVPTAGSSPEAAAPSQTAEPVMQAAETPVPDADPPAGPAAYGTVAADDAAVQAKQVEFPGADGAAVTGYLARPAGEGNALPVILVCHENRGLTAHIQDVTRRLAKAGYAALAVDLLARQGGTASFASGDVPGALGNTPETQFIEDFVAGWRWLQGQPFADAGRVGMVGFCFGGGVTWRVAVSMPELRAAVPFYGPHPPAPDAPKIQAAVLAIYGGNDTRINQGIPAIEEAMRQNNKIYEKMIYEGADHAFHNDTSTRYNADAARDAWNRTLAWFRRYVG